MKNDEESVFNFKKKSRSNVGRRQRAEESLPGNTDNTEVEIVEVESPIHRSISKDKTKTRKKPSSRLSFANDENERDDIKLKTKSFSSPFQGISTLQKEAVEQVLSPINRPSYTKQHLSELKSSTLSTSERINTHDDDISVGVKSGDLWGIIETIPDAAIIDAAKRRREMKRNGKSTEDFISIEAISSSKQESRFVREEDELGESLEGFEDSVSNRIGFGSQARAEAEKKRRLEMEEMIVDVEEEDEVDEEIKEWEAQHITMGTLRRDQSEKKKSEVFRSAPIPQVTPLPILSDVHKRLLSQKAVLEEDNEMQKSQLLQIEKEEKELVEQDREILEILNGSKAKYEFFQEFKMFAHDLASLMEKKIHILESLEVEQENLFSKYTEILNTKRKAGESGIVRIEDTQRGTFSYNLEESEEREFLDAYSEYLQTVKQMMDNVGPEFSSPKTILDYFKMWKTEYNEDYMKAYGALSIPSALEFYVRYDMLYWNVFVEGVKIDMLKWHKCVWSFANDDKMKVDQGMNNSNRNDNEDYESQIIMRILEKYVISRYVKWISGYDLFSSIHTQNVILFVEQISKCVTSTNEAYMVLIQAIKKHLRENYVLPMIVKLLEIKMDDVSDTFYKDLQSLLVNLFAWKEVLKVEVSEISLLAFRSWSLPDTDRHVCLKAAKEFLDSFV